MPHPDEIRLLKLRPGVPVLDVWHTSIDQDGEPFSPAEVTFARLALGAAVLFAVMVARREAGTGCVASGSIGGNPFHQRLHLHR